MTVRRIVADLAADAPRDVAAFYKALLDLDIAMDMGWIVTLRGDTQAPVQLSIASEGGSGTGVPYLSIEVDDVVEVFARAEALKAEIVYPLTEEPWGVRRFFVTDPSGRTLNILQHI